MSPQRERWMIKKKKARRTQKKAAKRNAAPLHWGGGAPGPHLHPQTLTAARAGRSTFWLAPPNTDYNLRRRKREAAIKERNAPAALREMRQTTLPQLASLVATHLQWGSPGSLLDLRCHKAAKHQQTAHPLCLLSPRFWARGAQHLTQPPNYKQWKAGWIHLATPSGKTQVLRLLGVPLALLLTRTKSLKAKVCLLLHRLTR